MSISIDGIDFIGTHGQIVAMAPQLRVIRKSFSGVDGESEIQAGKTGRALWCEIVLHDRHNAAQMEAVLAITEHVFLGRHGMLLSTDPQTNYFQQFPNTTYMGFERDQMTPAPLYDYAGTIDGRWWIRGKLHFYQLLIP